MGTVFNTPDDGCCDTQNMQSSFAVNKYLHTVASVGFLFALNYDARNHELIIYMFVCYKQVMCVSPVMASSGFYVKSENKSFCIQA